MQLVAWLAAALVFMSFFMKTIVPLRMIAIASNVVFIAYALMGLHYGVFDKVLPILVLHLSLLPLNVSMDLATPEPCTSEIGGTELLVRSAAGTAHLLSPYGTPTDRAESLAR